MGSTKILNIQKNDSFDEVFDAFQQTEAQEVIFIFPKGTMFSRQGGYFKAIQEEAERTGKVVNVMSTDPMIGQLASAHGFGVLQAPTPRKRTAIPELAEPQSEPESEFEPEPEAEPIAELAVARKKPVAKKATYPVADDGSKKIRDIMTPNEDHELAVEENDEKEEMIELSRGDLFPKTPAQAPEPLSTPLQQSVTHTAPISPMTDIEKLWEAEERRQNPDGMPDQPKPKRKLFGKISKKFIAVPIVLAIVALGVILYMTLGNAKIVIKPKGEEVDFKLKMTAAASVDAVSEELNQIPGQYFSIEKEATGSYPSTSEKEVAQKASGKITIFNTSKESQRLVATTRFESKEGLVFRIPETITVPAGGKIDSLVYADRPGKEYNIGPTKFTIPGFAGTPRFDLFYATSESAMTGGIVGTAKVVAEQDFIKAKEELSTKAKEAVEVALKEQLTDLKSFEPYSITVKEPIVNAKAGEAADTLEMKVTAVIELVAFQPAAVNQLLQSYVEKNGNLELVEKNTEISYRVLKMDLENKSVQFETTVKGMAVSKIDQARIIKEIQGKNESGIRSYFESMKEVDSARVMLSPFWVTKVPRDTSKIELTIDIP